MTIRMDVQSSEVFELKRLDTLEKNYKDLLQEHSTLKSQFKLMPDQIDNQRASSDELEQYTRNDNILIHGVAFPQDNTSDGDLTGCWSLM